MDPKWFLNKDRNQESNQPKKKKPTFPGKRGIFDNNPKKKPPTPGQIWSPKKDDSFNPQPQQSSSQTPNYAQQTQVPLNKADQSGYPQQNQNPINLSAYTQPQPKPQSSAPQTQPINYQAQPNQSDYTQQQNLSQYTQQPIQPDYGQQTNQQPIQPDYGQQTNQQPIQPDYGQQTNQQPIQPDYGQQQSQPAGQVNTPSYNPQSPSDSPSSGQTRAIQPLSPQEQQQEQQQQEQQGYFQQQNVPASNPQGVPSFPPQMPSPPQLPSASELRPPDSSNLSGYPRTTPQQLNQDHPSMANVEQNPMWNAPQGMPQVPNQEPPSMSSIEQTAMWSMPSPEEMLTAQQNLEQNATWPNQQQDGGMPFPSSQEQMDSNVPWFVQDQQFAPTQNSPGASQSQFALFSNAFSPIQLSPGQYSIGREQNNSIVLSDNTVSKVHTIVILDQMGMPYLSDAGSRNGTLLNGEKIQGRVPLRVGDKISIGKNHIFLKDLNAQQQPNNNKNPAAMINNDTMALNFDGQDSMIGSLSSMSLLELFSTLEANKKSGLLTVMADGDEGEVYFRKGKIIKSNYKEDINIDCIFEILKLNQGGFEFSVQQFEELEDEFPYSTQQILLEFTRIMDEEQ